MHQEHHNSNLGLSVLIVELTKITPDNQLHSPTQNQKKRVIDCQEDNVVVHSPQG